MTLPVFILYLSFHFIYRVNDWRVSWVCPPPSLDSCPSFSLWIQLRRKLREESTVNFIFIILCWEWMQGDRVQHKTTWNEDALFLSFHSLFLHNLNMKRFLSLYSLILNRLGNWFLFHFISCLTQDNPDTILMLFFPSRDSLSEKKNQELTT